MHRYMLPPSLYKINLSSIINHPFVTNIFMELILLLCSFFFFSFVLLKLAKRTKLLKLPPGPRPLPIIGNMHQLYGGLIHHKLRDLAKKHGPLMHLQLGEVLTIIASSPEVAKQVYKTRDLIFSNRPSCFESYKAVSYDFTDIIFSPYGNYWRELRKICTMELLSTKRVQSFGSIREEETLNMIRSIISLNEGENNNNNSKVVNLSQKIFSLTYSITSRIAFGKRNKDQERFEGLVDEISKLAAGFSIADLYPSIKLLRVISGMERKLKRVQREVDEILQNILNEHRDQEMMMKGESGEANKEDDLVDVLLNIQKSEDFEVPLSDNNLKAVLFDIFSAGSDTSTTILEWAISETLKNSRILKRAQEETRNVYNEKGNVDESRINELKYIKAIINETLRLHPSAPLLLPRECNEQCKIYGFDIPLKARIIVNAWAIARDPKFWNDAEKFNPERFFDSESEVDYRGNDFKYIPFGAGRRICPGITYALPNIILPFAQLLFHFDWKLPGGLELEALDMTERMGVTVRRKDDLKLIPILNPCSSLMKKT
ncbi:hypothetical protein M9H77_04966 [Catharanthus roseus]|uniref:Uncharacterized protein n=1 Tax=Catharanthus roseus TaxID=4058 RepID=A0ACC0CFI9_CATRO|nr:hypothetical protein M9H77_04966 [Catharanthus roseus]